MYCNYTTHKVVSFQYQSISVYSSNILKISQISASIFSKKEKSVLRISNQGGDGKGDVNL